MTTEVSGLLYHDRAEIARMLARLRESLGAFSALSDIGDLTVAQLAAWKPQIERMVFEDPRRAEELARWMLTVAEATAMPEMLALAYWTAGNVRLLLDRPQEALAALAEAEALYQTRGEALSIARLSVSVVSALDKVGRYREAIRCGQAALPILAASDDPADQRRVMSLYNGIGISSEHIGRYAEALAAYEQKWRWWRDREGDTARIEAARAQINIGLVNTRLGQYTEAHEAFTQAYQALTTVPPTGQTRIEAARCAMNLAWLESLRRSPPEVVREAFARARAARAAADPQGESTDLALLDLFEAEWLIETGAEAAENLQPAIMMLSERLAAAGLAFEAARAGLLLARLALRAGEWARAQGEYAALAAAATGRGDAETAYLAGVGMARAHRAAGDLSGGRKALERVIATVEGMRAGLRHEEHRVGFLDDKLIAYRELAALCLAQDDIAAALHAFERSRARTLAELLAWRGDGQEPEPEHADEAAALLEAERQLRAHLEALPEENRAARRELERELLAIRRQLAQFRHVALGAAAPIPNLEEVCALLPAETLLLVYGVLPGQVVVFPCDRQGLLEPPCSVGPLPDPDALRLDLARLAAVGHLPREIARRRADQQIRSAQVPLATWFDRYLGPLRRLLWRYPKLLLVPDDLLNLLPFGAFYDRETGRYLAQSHELLSAPSLTTWAMLAQRRAPASDRVLAVGFSAGGRLHRTVDEARAVAGLFRRHELLLEEKATRANVARALSEAGLVHMATHGLYRADAPAFSYLELADGRLEAFDIARLKLDAATVILSACETGVGHLSGNELMGLVRVFLYAGARSVLATQWVVDDEAMAAFVTDLVGRMAAGRTVTQALHEVQVAWLAAQNGTLLAHPYFWGALTPVGVDAQVAS